jgi:leader peptidase (prepilin peptidase)/N-methyltransferase
VRDGTLWAVAVAVAAGVGAGPYLAGLTRTVPDRSAEQWWRGTRVGSGRVACAMAVATGLAALGALATGWAAALPAFVVLGLFGTPLAVVDVECRRLPDRLLGPAALTGGVLLAWAAVLTSDAGSLLRAALAAGVTFVGFFLAALAVPGELGFGDVKLAAVLGGHLGWLGWGPLIVGVFAGFAVGTVVACVLILVGRASWRSSLPFGPALIVGAFGVAAGHGLF